MVLGHAVERGTSVRLALTNVQRPTSRPKRDGEAGVEPCNSPRVSACGVIAEQCGRTLGVADVRGRISFGLRLPHVGRSVMTVTCSLTPRRTAVPRLTSRTNIRRTLGVAIVRECLLRPRHRV